MFPVIFPEHEYAARDDREASYSFEYDDVEYTANDKFIVLAVPFPLVTFPQRFLEKFCNDRNIRGIDYVDLNTIGVFPLLTLSRMMYIQRFLPDLDEFPISKMFEGEE